MKVYKMIDFDGKERFYTYPYEGQRYIYKERKKSLDDWIKRLVDLLIKAKYNKDDIQSIILYFVKVKGYWQHENYYIKPWILVQNLNDLGGVENIEFV